MATKLYLHAAPDAQLGTFPTGKQAAVTAAWSASDAGTIKRLTSIAGVVQAYSSGNSSAVTAAQYGYLGMFVSGPLTGAQTVGGGSITLANATNEAATFGNFWQNALAVYVWRPSTGAIVGFVKTPAGSLGGAPHSALGELSTLISGIPSTAVAAADGDVIIVEFWAYHTQSTAQSNTGTFYYDGATEITADNAAVTDAASYIQFTENLVIGEPRNSWVSQQAPSAQQWSRAVFGNGHQVIVGGATFGAYSTDNGETWTASTLPAAANTNGWSGLVFNGAVHVALDNAGFSCSSSDGGVTWGAVVSIGATDDWGDVAANPAGAILAVSSDYINTAYSTDGGASWTVGSFPANGNFVGVVWDKKKGNWIVINGLKATTLAFTSPDAVTWTQRTLPASKTWSSIDSDGAGTVIAVSGLYQSGGAASATAAKSTDGGATWSSLTLPASDKWAEIRFGTDRWMLMPYQGARTFYSLDGGGTWTLVQPFPVADFFHMGYGNGVFMATGLNSSFAATPLIAAYYRASFSSDLSLPLTGSKITSKPGGVTFVAPSGSVSKSITGSRITSKGGSVVVPGSGTLPADPGSTITIGPITSTNSAPNESFQQVYGGYNFAMNVWAPPATYSQTIQATVQSQYGVQSFQIDWNFAGSSTNVKTYPNVQVGQQTASFVPTDSRWPVQISNIKSLTTQGSMNTTTTGSVCFDAAYDLFLSVGTPSPQDVGAELMVMHQWNLPGFGQGNSGQQTIGGRTYTVQKLTLSSGGYSWPYVAYYAINQTEDISVDLLAFINNAQSNGFLPSTMKYVDMVELGIEVQYGQGSTLLTNYAVDLELLVTPPPPTYTWVIRGAPTADGWSRAEFGNGNHVIVAGTNKGAWSPDNGVHWNPVSLPVTTGTWGHVVFTGRKHVAIDDGGGKSCSSSDGGKTWGAVVPIGSTDNWGDAKADSSGNILAVSADYINTAYSTDDGASWTIGSMPVGGSYGGVAWDAVHSTWLVVRTGIASTTVYTSADASNWTLRTLPASVEWSDLDSDQAGNVIAVAGGGGYNGGVSSNVAAISKDGGVTWASLVLPATAHWVRIRWGAGAWMATAYNSSNSAVSFDNGATWKLDTSLAPADWLNLGFGNNVFMSSGLDASYGPTSLIEVYPLSASPGNLTVQMPGSRASSKAGNVASTRSLHANGNRATSKTGKIAFSSAQSVSVQMRGGRLTAAAGQIKYTGAVGTHITGERMAIGQGSMVPLVPTTLTGLSLASNGGSLSVAPRSAALSGNNVATGQGSLSPLIFSDSPSVYVSIVPANDDDVVVTP